MAHDLMATDPSQPRPSEAEITAFWQSVLVRCDPSDEVLSTARWLQEMRRLYANGGVAAARFELVGEPAVFDWFAQRSRLGEEIQICAHLLACVDVSHALFGSEAQRPRLDGVAFTEMSGFMLEGELAEQLAIGGAYLRFGGSDSEAQKVACELADALTQGRASELTVFRSTDAWHAWFKGCSALDRTWVIVDRRHRVVTVVVTTDES
jgi:hypothetical protein